LGANEGYFSILASKRCGPTGKVYAIEPQARCQEVIRENCRLNQCANVSILPVAICDRAGRITLHLHPATNTGATSMWQTARSSLRTSLVECMTLQAALDTNRINAVHLLKIDIEGAEYEAVLGSPEVFRSGRVKVIALEYHPDILSSRGLQVVTIHDFLLKAGYTLDSTFSNSVYVKIN
jgi:FkbM family methyltransferase